LARVFPDDFRVFQGLRPGFATGIHKKRFKITASGKIKAAQAGKRHGMIKRTRKFIRDARGTTVLSEPDTKIVKQFMPYG